MAIIQNQDLINSLRVAARISNVEPVPTKLGETIVPIVDATPYKFSNFVVANSSTTTGTITATLPVPSVNGDIYITGISYSYIKDATCDIASGALGLTLTPDATGRAVNIMRIAVLTLTAQSESNFLLLPFPLKIKNGTNATLDGAFTVGALSRGISVLGFITS